MQNPCQVQNPWTFICSVHFNAPPCQGQTLSAQCARAGIGFHQHSAKDSRKGPTQPDVHPLHLCCERVHPCRVRVRPALPRLSVVVPETEICLAFLLEDLTGCASAASNLLVTQPLPPPQPQQQQQQQQQQLPGGFQEQAAWQGLAFEGQACRPRPQPVFAFLPLRTYGLRFVLQVCGGVGTLSLVLLVVKLMYAVDSGL